MVYQDNMNVSGVYIGKIITKHVCIHHPQTSLMALRGSKKMSVDDDYDELFCESFHRWK